MTKELTTSPIPGGQKMFTEEDIKTIREAYGAGATESEFKIFIHVCEQCRLNPFTKQIYFAKIGTKMTVLASIDGLRLVAERTGKYVPGRESTFIYDKQGNLYSATSYVKKFGPDKTWHEVPGVAIFNEYKKPGAGGVWDKMPHVMLAKCAESLALRKAFPADLSGIYSEDEMEQADVQVISSKMITQSPKIEINEEAQKIQHITEEQVNEIETNILPGDAEYRLELLTYFGKKDAPLENFSKLPASKFESAMVAIMKRKAKMKPDGEEF